MQPHTNRITDSNLINLNGQIVESDKAFVSINNRGLHYGDALFETLLVVKGTVLFWEDHYFRLMASMRILRMEIPMNFTMEYLKSEIDKTISDNLSKSFRVKILVWRKTGGKYHPDTRMIDYAIIPEEVNFNKYKLDTSPYEVELYKDFYVRKDLLATLKTTNKIVNVLGSIFAKENGYQNCLVLNDAKNVIEALNANLFMVNQDTITTPPLSEGCLNGIMRKQLIKIIDSHPEYKLEERLVSPFELQKADELFLSNVVFGIRPITKYRKKEYGISVSQEILTLLNKRTFDLISSNSDSQAH